MHTSGIDSACAVSTGLSCHWYSSQIPILPMFQHIKSVSVENRHVYNEACCNQSNGRQAGEKECLMMFILCDQLAWSCKACPHMLVDFSSGSTNWN